MSALFIKDLFVLRKNMRSYLLLILLFLLMPLFTPDKLFYVIYPMMLTVTCIVSFISIDENCGFQSYCDAMPISRRTVVAEKYILALSLNMLIFILSVAVRTPEAVSEGAFLPMLMMIAFISAASLILLSASLPMLFKFGVSRGKLAYLVILACVGIFIGLGSSLSFESESTAALLSHGLPMLVAAVAVLYYLSFRLSARLYGRREL